MLTGVVPAQVLAALSAQAERPGMIRKPGVVESRLAGLAATQRLQEGNDLEANSVGIGKGELVLSSVFEAIAFVGDPVVAPNAEPIGGSIGSGCSCVSS